jgi:methyl-accepting chemotaxis protein
LELLRENHREGTEILSSQAALMFYTVVHEGRRKLNSDIFGKISHIGEEIVGSTASVKKALAAITQVAFNLEMLSINAAIEAARAGVHGRSFAVVAEEVKTTAGQAKSLLASIEAVNNNNVVMSEELEELLNQLH